MPKEIYNEGRVVGMSAYELYIRHLLSEYPDLDPVTEREWLSSTIGAGCSLIMKLHAGTEAGIVDKALPDNSTLCGCGAIVASVFDGRVVTDSTDTWAVRVSSYGPLISNTLESHPSTPGNNIETVPASAGWTDEERNQITEYLNVVDGVIYQPGEWTGSDGRSPYADLTDPDLSQLSRIRLRISKKLRSDVYILLSGFTHRQIAAGVAKLDSGTVNPIHPWNGDFLGPERFPWAVKITFMLSSEISHLLDSIAYVRELPQGQPSESVASKSIIDMNSTTMQEFYATNDTTSYVKPLSDSSIHTKVVDLNVNTDHASVLAVHQRNDATSGSFSGADFPPALYGGKVTAEGEQDIVPVDVVSPGTIKVFDDLSKATAYPNIIPNTYAIWHDKQSKTYSFIDGDTRIAIGASAETKNLGTAAAPKYTSVVSAGGKTTNSISLSDTSGNLLNTSGSSGVQDATTTLNWTALINALGNNKSIEILGTSLKTFRQNLPNIKTSGVLQIDGTGPGYVAGPLTFNKGVTVKSTTGSDGNPYNVMTDDDWLKINKPLLNGANYIKLGPGDGLRFYVSSSAPSTSGVPVGSIGVGW